jgi:ectoine hydroxylase-related dioxygenase (phytanoyl-CoA dioxygenase family)
VTFAVADGLTAAERAAFATDGFVIRRRFASTVTVTAMLETARALGEAADAGRAIGDALLMEEPALGAHGPSRERLAKIFRVHRTEPCFHAFAVAPETTALVASLIGPDLDCFLSQFIFKMPGALGQPWHQDAFYFPFERPFEGACEIGLWLAVTEAHERNGPLWVLPGSHREPVHTVVRDRREHALGGYFEIVDHDMTGAVPVLMEPGDLLVFHGHLMHRSTDNGSHELRAAMVYHYAAAGTIDRSEQKFGFRPRNQDWLAVRRRSDCLRADDGR